MICSVYKAMKSGRFQIGGFGRELGRGGSVTNRVNLFCCCQSLNLSLDLNAIIFNIYYFTCVVHCHSHSSADNLLTWFIFFSHILKANKLPGGISGGNPWLQLNPPKVPPNSSNFEWSVWNYYWYPFLQTECQGIQKREQWKGITKKSKGYNFPLVLCLCWWKIPSTMGLDLIWHFKNSRGKV